jgi:hypothetical protein
MAHWSGHRSVGREQRQVVECLALRGRRPRGELDRLPRRFGLVLPVALDEQFVRLVLAPTGLGEQGFERVGVPAGAVAAAWPQRDRPAPGGPLWRSQKGNALSAPAMWRVIHGLVQECARRKLVPAATTPHTLRHTFAHRYLDAHPEDLVGRARLLGHTDLNTTAIYTQLTADELADRLDRLPLNAYE